MSKLFISYSKQNKDYARLLTTKLIEEGFDVWIDDVIDPSDNWWRTIRQAIRDCAAFILIMTPKSENSHWVVQELAYALELKKPFFPLLREGNPNLLHSDVWSRFASIQAIDIRQGQLPSNGFYGKLRERSQLPQNRLMSIDLMPKPFEWIEIPAGKVTIGRNPRAIGGYIDKATTFDVSTFSIAKYPVTNSQFTKFIEAGGYGQKHWWTDAGWQRLEKREWDKPYFWHDELWNKADYPVVGVSWYEAIAFCRWLSASTGEMITLPTDQQWQRATQGDTGWNYPYANTFDKERCNFNSEGTTPVTQYEGKDKGDSPFGVTDMSGNVWEWCLTQYARFDNRLDGTNIRMLRGGSWRYDLSDLLCVDYRNRDDPGNWNEILGFRIVRS